MKDTMPFLILLALIIVPNFIAIKDGTDVILFLLLLWFIYACFREANKK